MGEVSHSPIPEANWTAPARVIVFGPRRLQRPDRDLPRVRGGVHPAARGAGEVECPVTRATKDSGTPAATILDAQEWRNVWTETPIISRDFARRRNRVVYRASRRSYRS